MGWVKKVVVKSVMVLTPPQKVLLELALDKQQPRPHLMQQQKQLPMQQ